MYKTIVLVCYVKLNFADLHVRDVICALSTRAVANFKKIHYVVDFQAFDQDGAGRRRHQARRQHLRVRVVHVVPRRRRPRPADDSVGHRRRAAPRKGSRRRRRVCRQVSGLVGTKTLHWPRMTDSVFYGPMLPIVF